MTNYWYVYLISIPLGIAVVVSPLWRFVRFFETVFHEFGHAFVGMLLGQKLHGFKLRFNTSGETVMLSSGYGLRAAASQLAGYPAPIIIGCLGLYYSYYGYSVTITWIYVGICIFMAVFIRNLFGFIPLMIVGSLAGVSLYLDSYNVPASFIFTSLTGVMLVISGFRSLIDLFRFLPEGSDVWMLRDRTFIGQRFWVVLMFLFSVLFVVLNILFINWISGQIEALYIVADNAKNTISGF